MYKQKSIRELRSILNSLKSKLVDLDQNAVRDKEKDYQLRTQSELDHLLRSEMPIEEKKNILISQIGLVRINLFMEHYERVNRFEKNKQFDEAIKVMNYYVKNVAIPFIGPTKKPSLIQRFINWITREKAIEPLEYIKNWGYQYRSWFEENETTTIPALRESRKKEKFDKLKHIFHMLYCFSFSKEDLPPEPIIVYYDPRRVSF